MAFGDILGALSVSGTSITNPFSATGSVSVSVGDLIFCTLAEQVNLTVTSVTDNLHTPTNYTAQNAGSSDGTVNGRSFFIVATVAGTLTSINATCTASGDNASFSAVVISGPFLATASVVDRNRPNVTGSGAQPLPTPFPSTTSLNQAGEVVVSWITNLNKIIGPSIASPALLAKDTSDSQSVTEALIACEVTQALTSVTIAFSGGNDTNVNSWVAGTVTFKQKAIANSQTLTFSQSETVTLLAGKKFGELFTLLMAEAVTLVPIRARLKVISATSTQAITLARTAGKLIRISSAQSVRLTRGFGKSMNITLVQLVTLTSLVRKLIIVIQAQLVGLTVNKTIRRTILILQGQVASLARLKGHITNLLISIISAQLGSLLTRFIPGPPPPPPPKRLIINGWYVDSHGGLYYTYRTEDDQPGPEPPVSN